MNNAFEKMLFTQEGWSDFFRSDYVSKKTGETFSEVLSRYLDEIQARYGIRQQQIANTSGIASTMITKYRNGVRKPNLYSIVMLCIAMRLTYDRSEYLLYVAGYTLNESREHRVYKLFLMGCTFGDIFNVNNCKSELSKI